MATTRSLSRRLGQLSLAEKQVDKLSISSSSKCLVKKKQSVASRGLSEKEWNLYVKAVRESQGFDVPNFPLFRAGIIKHAFESMYKTDKFELLAMKAIYHYKSQVNQNADPEFHRVVKANFQYIGTLRTYYLTFEARDVADHGHLKTYQAKVNQTFKDISVESCRLKPTAA